MQFASFPAKSTAVDTPINGRKLLALSMLGVPQKN
jgi:hypothetical protein